MIEGEWSLDASSGIDRLEINEAGQTCAESQDQANKKEELKWEKNGKKTLANWLNGGISRRGDHEENPDRDKN